MYRSFWLMLIREKLDLLLVFLVSGSLIIAISAFGIFASISERQAALLQEQGIFQQNYLSKRPIDNTNREPRPSGQFKPFPTPTFISYPICETRPCIDEALDRQRPFAVELETGVGGTIKRVIDTSK